LRTLSAIQKNVALTSYRFRISNTHSVTSGIGPSSKVKCTTFDRLSRFQVYLGNSNGKSVLDIFMTQMYKKRVVN